MINKDIKISIIIINKDDFGISDTLDALNRIKKPNNTEVIVVDASADRLDEIRIAYKEVMWIKFENKSSKKITIPEQRNVGIKNSSGDLIIFIDANCIPDKNWLSLIVSTALKEKQFIVAGGVSPSNNNEINTIAHRSNKKYISEAPTINLLINKQVIKKIGLFNEKGTYGEDVDFTWRAIDAGFKIRYLPEAFVIHNMGSFSEQCRRMYRYGGARLKLYLRHKNHIRKMSKEDFVMIVIYPIYVLLLPFALIFPIYFIFLIIPLIKNYKHHPFKNIAYNLCFGYGVLITLIFVPFSEERLNR